MRLGSLSAELDSITKEFDYGIVPGSATVFVRDELNGIGRLDLTLLEGVMIVLEVTDQGYKVTNLKPENPTHFLSHSHCIIRLPHVHPFAMWIQHFLPHKQSRLI